MPKHKKLEIKWYHQPHWAAVIAVVALGAAYLMASRALHTGSWQQYFMTLALIILCLNRIAHLIKGAFHRLVA